tara:strand:- start:44 stop:322 length:279 start_codon:yes stop_codon:yes gene_type:complete
MEIKTKELIEEILKDEIEEMPTIERHFLKSTVEWRTLSSLKKLAELHETLTEQGVMNENIHWLIRDSMQDLNAIRQNTAKSQEEISDKLFSI